MGVEHPKPQKETIHNRETEHGEEQKPHRVLKDGVLVCPENEEYYDGWNQPWRM